MKILKWMKRFVLLLIPLFYCLPCILHAQAPPEYGGGWEFPPYLNSWSFNDTNTWQSDNGYAPLSFTNITKSSMGDIFNGFSVPLDSTNASWLQYNTMETDGTTNLTVDVGSVMFWFSPNWASASTNQNGTGPGDQGRLIEVGAYTTNADFGWWSIFLDEGGTNLYFSAQTNSGDGFIASYLSTPIDWASNEWHMVTLTYSATNSALYVDGELATNGSGVSIFPGADVLANGFWIGSDSNGVTQAHGLFDDIYTFDAPLSAEDVAYIYDLFSQFYRMNPFNMAFNIRSAPSTNTLYWPTVTAIYGTGYLQFIGAAGGIISSSNIWITNVVCTLTTNQTANFKFDIQGGYDNLTYDIFANGGLAHSGTNNQWGWMGQGYHGNTYQLTNLPISSAFVILGQPTDSDSDGYTDAYELLVGAMNPYDSNLSGDGLSDLYKTLHGLTLGGVVPVPALNSITLPTCAVP